MDFAQLKSLSAKGDSLKELTDKLNKITNTENKKGPDERLWTPTVDKGGNGFAIIRFLPAPNGEEDPFVRIFSHAFQGPTGLWYIENSLNTLGKPDPVSEFNTKLWNSVQSDDSDERKQVRRQKRKLQYISNIYVVQDQGNPANEGKVFLFKYGKKIFDKIKEAMVPQFEDETPMNPFDFWKGANFKLKIRNVEGYRNYDKSEFDKSKALFDTDDKIKEVYDKQYSLQAFLEPSNFKSYDDLKARLMRVLDVSNSSMPRAETMAEAPAPSPKAAVAPKIEESPFKDDEDEDSLEFFKNLAK